MTGLFLLIFARRHRDENLIRHELLSFEELPRPGTFVAIDAEFVSMQQVYFVEKLLTDCFFMCFVLDRKKQSTARMVPTASSALHVSVLLVYLSLGVMVRKKVSRSLMITSTLARLLLII